MYNVDLPESLYKHAQEAAGFQHVSVEKFVCEAIQLHINAAIEDQEPLKLTDHQLAQIRKSQAEIAEGKGMSLEQAWVELDRRKAEYLKANPID